MIFASRASRASLTAGALLTATALLTGCSSSDNDAKPNAGGISSPTASGSSQTIPTASATHSVQPKDQSSRPTDLDDWPTTPATEDQIPLSGNRAIAAGYTRGRTTRYSGSFCAHPDRP